MAVEKSTIPTNILMYTGPGNEYFMGPYTTMPKTGRKNDCVLMTPKGQKIHTRLDDLYIRCNEYSVTQPSPEQRVDRIPATDLGTLRDTIIIHVH